MIRDIRKITNLVEQTLRSEPETRNSDTELYLSVCLKLSPIACNMAFATVMKNRKELGIPNMETVRRARQKIQANIPSLRAVKEVEDERYENYKVVKEYATT